MLTRFSTAGRKQLDTSVAYGDGSSERILSDIKVAKRFEIAIRFHSGDFHRDELSMPKANVQRSFDKLKTDKFEILYLTFRFRKTLLDGTLRVVQELYKEEIFREFGLTDYAVWEIAQIAEICRSESWIEPPVHQRMYNAVTRAAEPELLLCLSENGIRFNAHNPFAGGAFLRDFGKGELLLQGIPF